MTVLGIPCCGKQHDTPFCPLCGKKLSERHELGDLLRHCETTLRVLKTEYAVRWLERGRQSQKRENTIARWERWAKGLRVIIESQMKGESGE